MPTTSGDGNTDNSSKSNSSKDREREKRGNEKEKVTEVTEGEGGEIKEETLGGASSDLETKTPRISCKGEEELAAQTASSSKTITLHKSKGKGGGGEESATGGGESATGAAKKSKVKSPRISKSGGEGEGSSGGAVKKPKTKTPRSSKGKEDENVASGAASSPKTKAPHSRNQKGGDSNSSPEHQGEPAKLIDVSIDSEAPNSPKNRGGVPNGALATTSLPDPTTALSVISNDVTSSSDPQWQPIVGRIRKTRKKPVLHEHPPLQIGSAEVSNAHQSYAISDISDRNLTQEEFNTHIQERIQRVSRGAPTPTGVARGVPKNELVARFENERTDHFKAKWRKYPEVPTTEELLREVVHLPTNVIDGPFESVDEYLEAHYELLREDAFSGLRDAVAHMRECPDSSDTNDVVIYEEVRVIGLTFSNMGVACKVSFSTNRAGKKIRWEQSKRLIPGTLVCVSSDNFQTVKVATVAARPKEGLDLNPPEIDLLFNESEIELDTQKELLMVESKNGYFEAYKWTLRALQRMTITNFPLHEHLCFLDSNVPPPVYVKKKPIFNLSSIFPDIPDKESLGDVDIINDWPQGVQTSMDNSQMTGLHQILTKRLGILQGPPGTGKTYVSKNALQALLENMREGDPPIIVACQTNHALDQLLNHVLKFETDFIRLGGRTADREKIKERTMHEMRQRTNVNIQGSGMSAAIANMRKIRDMMMKLLEPLKQELLTENDFYKFGLISSAQLRSFTSRAANWIVVEDDQRPGGCMGQWLGDYFVPIQTHESIENEFEEGDIEYERIKEMEAEFHGAPSDEIDGRLRGLFFAMSREYTVMEPEGVSMQEIHQGLQTSNVWELEEHIRAAMYHHLRAKVINLVWAQVKDLNIQYQKKSQEHRIAKLEKDAYILSTTKLIGMTTTGLSKYRSIVAAVKPKIVLIEEAAEALEGPVTVACMPSVEHLILVGDHQQLRGHCAVGDLEGHPYNLDISMFERLVTNGLPFVTLRTQRRMRPEIRELLEPIYHDKLVDHASVLGRESIQGMGDINVFWYSHAYDESTDEVKSRMNVLEAQMVVNFADYLVLNGMGPKNITILTFYAGQRSQIRKTIIKHPNLGNTLMKVQTVDSYQGEENDVILLSLVRSNSFNSIGFLSIQNRVCVALSRAKRGFYIFGNAEMTTTADALWWEIGRILNEPPSRIGTRLPLTCQKHKSRTEIEDVLDWIDINGGCRKLCKEILPCRHACTLRCHPFEHSEIRCISPCTKFLACGHQCVNRLCWEDCVCPKCGRGQKAIEEAPTNTKVAVRSTAGSVSDGRTRAIQEAPTPPSQAGPVALTGVRQPEGQRKFDGQLSNAKATNRQQGPPIPKLVEIDEWEAALPVNQQPQPVVIDQEEFPEMAVAIRSPPGLPNKQDGPPYRNGSDHYYAGDNYSYRADGPDMPTRGGGVYGVPRRHIKDRWPDEDENGQVIDDRMERDNRGGYRQEGSRGDYSPGNRGDYDQQDGRGEYGRMGDGRGYNQQGNIRDYNQKDDRGGYSQQGNQRDYSQRGDRGGYGQRGDRGGYGQRDDREGYGQRDDRESYGQRGDREGYGQRIDRGGYGQRDDRGGYSQRGDYDRRGSGGEYSQRDDRGDYSRQSNGRRYNQGDDEWEHNQRDDRKRYDQQGDGGDYDQQENKGEYSRQADRKSHSQQASGGRQPIQANDPWPALGAGRGNPKNTGRSQDPRQTSAWNGNGTPNRGPPGGGIGSRGSPGGGYDSPWGGQGRNGSRIANSYTNYR